MKFLSLEPFVPSGSNFENAKKLFLELGFNINWDSGDYIGFQRDDCRFILQKFDNKSFAENFMISVKINSADEFLKEVNDKKLTERFGIQLGKPTDEPYGREINLIDMAGVCWHFVEQFSR
jgi:hypothetical protein